jgi:LuxR family transcriptional regulator, maltose regulon positive regulatory protein
LVPKTVDIESAASRPGLQTTNGDAPRASVVSRDRLLEWLEGSRSYPTVMIEAPAGYGKSTLLRQWRDADRRPFAQLTLREHHDDAVLLAAHITDVVADHIPVDDNAYTALMGGNPAAVHIAVSRLLRCLREAGEPLVVALDDVHAISNPLALGVISELAQGWPPKAQLALASRSEPAIGLSRLRASRRIADLTAADLAMTRREAGDVLAGCGLSLTQETVTLLLERTEGWPAALYLAVRSLSAATDADAAARELAGDDRVIAEYLRDELISNLDADQLDFLRRTSILDEVSGEICNAILETEGSAATLRALARANTLVTPLDRAERRFRYHSLLREMLNNELHALQPGEESLAHARASRWFAGRGDFDRAIPHAIRSGDSSLASELIWSVAAEYETAGRGASVRTWLASLTEAQLHESPALCLTMAMLCTTDGDGAGVEHWLAATGDALDGFGGDGAAQISAATSLLRSASVPREGVIGIGRDVAAIADALPDGRWASLACLVHGMALHLSGDRDGAREVLDRGTRLGVAGAPNIGAHCRAQRALLALDESDLDSARAAAEGIRETVARYGFGEHPTQALPSAVVALVHARLGETRVASDELRNAEAQLGQLSEFSSWFEAETLVTLARAKLLLDDIAGARAKLSAAGAPLRRIPDAVVLRDWIRQAWEDADAARAVTGRWPLTPAELRLLHQLPTHLTFKEIAEELFVSPNTVKTQARSIYRKLGASGRAEAVACARAAGLLSPEHDGG